MRYRFPGKEWISTLVVAPILVYIFLPEVVLGVALLLLHALGVGAKSFALVLMGTC